VKRSGRRGVAWHDKIAAAVLVGRCVRWAGWRGVDSAPSHPILHHFVGPWHHVRSSWVAFPKAHAHAGCRVFVRRVPADAGAGAASGVCV
jgi:hypothetical protein